MRISAFARTTAKRVERNGSSVDGDELYQHAAILALSQVALPSTIIPLRAGNQRFVSGRTPHPHHRRHSEPIRPSLRTPAQLAQCVHVWGLADTTRSFTGQTGRIEPVEDAHLGKSYLGTCRRFSDWRWAANPTHAARGAGDAERCHLHAQISAVALVQQAPTRSMGPSSTCAWAAPGAAFQKPLA